MRNIHVSIPVMRAPVVALRLARRQPALSGIEGRFAPQLVFFAFLPVKLWGYP
jgi:hypothetical protein